MSETPDELLKQVNATEKECLSRATRKAYWQKVAAFINWLYHQRRNMLAPALVANLERIGEEETLPGTLSPKFFTKHPDLVSESDYPFSDDLDTETIKLYLASLKRNGEPCTANYKRDVKSAIRSRILLSERDLPEGFDKDMKKYLRGASNQRAAAVEDAGEANDVGKKDLKIEMLKKLAALTFAGAGAFGNDAWFHAWLLFQFVLMARVHNIQSLSIKQISVCNDSLEVTFPKSKVDQDGAWSRFPKLVFANPYNPIVCPILALALYLGVNPDIVRNRSHLFPGSDQGGRYSKKLKKYLTAIGVPEDVLKDLTSHSLRKAGITYATCAVLLGPGQHVVSIRAGWKEGLGNVKWRYILGDAAGDAFLGRLLSLLSPHHPSFAVLPPLWVNPDAEDVMTALKMLWPSAEDDQIPVLKFLLASLIYHLQYIRTHSPSHPILTCQVFADEELMTRCRDNIAVKIPEDGDEIQARGIPPYTLQSGQIREMAALLRTIVANQENQLDRIAEILRAVLDERQEQMDEERGTVTRSYMENEYKRFESMLKQTADDLRELVVTATRGIPDADVVDETPVVESRTGSVQVYNYGGRFHRVPQGYILPKMVTERMLSVYYFGDSTIPPIHNLPANEFDKMQHGRLRKLHSLVRQFEETVVRVMGNIGTVENVKAAIRSQADLDRLWNVVRPHLIPSETPKGRKRRIHEMKWDTVQTLESARRRRAAAPVNITSDACGYCHLSSQKTGRM